MGAVRHVLLATDERYAMPLAVTLRSLVDAGGGPFSITVLHDAVSPTAQRRVAGTLDHAEHDLRWVDLSDSDVGDTAAFHLPPAAYYRLLAGDVLDGSIERVLYLDTDVLVCDDLEPLWEVELDDAVVAAVRSMNYPSLGTRGACDHWRDLGIDPRAPYFNSGVMVIDLERWRRAGIGERSLEYLRSKYANLRTADQEGLNVALESQWAELAPRWNQQSPILDDQHGAHLIHSADEVDDARDRPAVIHFLDRPKPWHRDCVHPRRERWRQVAATTAFAPISLERTPWSDEARWRIKRAASALVKGR